jgi:hypothetical protein
MNQNDWIGGWVRHSAGRSTEERATEALLLGTMLLDNVVMAPEVGHITMQAPSQRVALPPAEIR